jgi:DNA-directed RNA polymerase subunit RPC12/RpoP
VLDRLGQGIEKRLQKPCCGGESTHSLSHARLDHALRCWKCVSIVFVKRRPTSSKHYEKRATLRIHRYGYSDARLCSTQSSVSSVDQSGADGRSSHRCARSQDAHRSSVHSTVSHSMLCHGHTNDTAKESAEAVSSTTDQSECWRGRVRW